MHAKRTGFFLFSVMVAASLAWAKFEVPALTGPVVDRANLLSAATEQQLERAIRDLNGSGGSQITVLTIPSLEGLSIEQAAIQVADVWKLGTAKDDRGVLLLIARDERRVRIEVGQGNEGSLTDVQSKRIISNVMTPLFRAGDFDSGVLLGVVQIAQATDPGIDLSAYLEGSGLDRRSRKVTQGGTSLGRLIVIVIFFIFIIVQIFSGGGGGHGRLRRRNGLYYGGSWGGGGFSYGGSGGFGGGWSGGGGGFSGGGASGSW